MSVWADGGVYVGTINIIYFVSCYIEAYFYTEVWGNEVVFN